MKEIWKDIQDYEELYQVSNLGRIKSLKRTFKIYNRFSALSNINVKEKIKKLTKDKNGYLIVSISKNGYEKKCKVHRLVAQTFVPNPNRYNEINHIDGNKRNNNVSNLEWCTRNKNMKHASETNLMKPILGQKNPLSKAVIQYDKNMNKIAEYGSINEAGRKTGYGSQNIGNCCRGAKHCKTAYGYIWKYKEE